MRRREFVLQGAATALFLSGVKPVLGRWSSVGDIKYLEIGRVWSGAPVGFDAVSASGFFFIAYYGEDRSLVITKVAASGEIVSESRCNVGFDGWDSHKGIKVAVDQDGILHLAANVHGSPIVYLRGRKPLDVSSLARSQMVGLRESAMTYPTFLLSRNGPLFFLYRDGVSGNGSWLCNKWEGFDWTRVGDKPIFSSSDFEHGHVSAYPSNIIQSASGWFYVALMWRLPGNASQNFRITVAKTKDMLTWIDSIGREIELPVDPTEGDMVDNPGTNSGLLNTHKLALDPSTNSPVISFTKYNNDGHNGIYIAFRDGGHWIEREVASSTTRYPIEGQGSLNNVPGVGPVEFRNGAVSIGYHFPGVGRFAQRLNPTTFRPMGPPEKARNPVPASIVGMRPDLLNRVVSFRPVCSQHGGDSDTEFILWSTQGANNDRPRACTDTDPTACSPSPDKLKLIIMPKQT